MLLFIFFVFGLFEWMQVCAGFLSFVCIPLNGLTPPPFCVCPNPGDGFFNPICQITTQLHCGGHLGGRARLPNTILEKDHPMSIPSKVGSN
jgi:hypothetical protein